MLIFLLVSAIIIFLFLLQKRHYRHQQEKNRLQQEMLRAQVEVQQQTLQHVAQEIHDNIGQLLSIIKISLNTIEESPETNPHLAQVVKTNELVSRVINGLRDLSKGLNPDFVQQFGLAGCIQFELERLENTRKYETGFKLTGQQYGLDLSTEFVIYRVVQELLNNIIKHAAAGRIDVAMAYGPEKTTIEVSDNGRGFERNGALSGMDAAGSGSGIANMHKRMQLAGGRLSITSLPGQGTRALIEITKPQNPERNA